MMIFYLLFALFNMVHSFAPSCSSCKFFIPNGDKPDLGLCSMFQERINDSNLVKNMAVHCRNDENQCGESGFLYESNKTNPTEKDSKKMENYEYIKSVCSGEFVDDDDLTKLEKLELEMVNAFQKMRRHNKKIIYKNVKNIYNLFKKKDFDL
jgi:hypothetical protein